MSDFNFALNTASVEVPRTDAGLDGVLTALLVAVKDIEQILASKTSLDLGSKELEILIGGFNATDKKEFAGAWVTQGAHAVIDTAEISCRTWVTSVTPADRPKLFARLGEVGALRRGLPYTAAESNRFLMAATGQTGKVNVFKKY